MINPADDEINILLPLFFWAFVLVIIGVVGLSLWLLMKIDVSDERHIPRVLKAGFLSLLGGFCFMTIVGVVVFIVKIAISFFKVNF